MIVTNKQYERIQRWELEWWETNEYTPEKAWSHYDPHFEPYLDPFDIVADVGCGPHPYIFNPKICYHAAWAIDPWIFRYQKIPRYRPVWKHKLICCAKDTSIFQDGHLDALFALNMLDHVQAPVETLLEFCRVLSPGGRLFLAVDVGKKPDAMHPHCIDQTWLLKWLTDRFDVLHFASEPSWKFANDVFYLVGQRKEEPDDEEKE